MHSREDSRDGGVDNCASVVDRRGIEGLVLGSADGGWGCGEFWNG
jgi:hypothetical protein